MSKLRLSVNSGDIKLSTVQFNPFWTRSRFVHCKPRHAYPSISFIIHLRKRNAPLLSKATTRLRYLNLALLLLVLPTQFSKPPMSVFLLATRI